MCMYAGVFEFGIQQRYQSESTAIIEFGSYRYFVEFCDIVNSLSSVQLKVLKVNIHHDLRITKYGVLVLSVIFSFNTSVTS